MSQSAYESMIGFALVFVGIPPSWALIWAFIVAVKKWQDK